METSEFIRKLTGRFLWLNLLAMAIFIALVIFSTGIAMDIYTHHGESIAVPDVRKHSYEASVKELERLGMQVVVNDTGYVKELAAGMILDQLPAPGTRVKSGRTIFLTINTTNSPTIVLPDLIDNCSLREAMAKLSALGFKLGQTQYVSGEKDWVYGILANGKSVSTGDRISIESTLVIQTGNGQRDASDSVYITDIPEDFDIIPENEEIEIISSTEPGGNSDDFEIVE